MSGFYHRSPRKKVRGGGVGNPLPIALPAAVFALCPRIDALSEKPWHNILAASYFASLFSAGKTELFKLSSLLLQYLPPFFGTNPSPGRNCAFCREENCGMKMGVSLTTCSLPFFQFAKRRRCDPIDHLEKFSSEWLWIGLCIALGTGMGKETDCCNRENPPWFGTPTEQINLQEKY